MRRSLLTLIMMPIMACTATTGETTLAPTTTPPPSSTTVTVEQTTTIASTAPETTAPTTQPAAIVPEDLVLESFPVPAGSGPHDVAPALDGGIWYTAQDTGSWAGSTPPQARRDIPPLETARRPTV